MSSTFPNQIDNIPNFLDVTNQDGQLIKQYKQYMEQNDFSNANNTLSQISDADKKIVSATKLNKLRDCIIALEEFYGSDIKPYLNEKQNLWQSIINQFSYVGEYSSSKVYRINNIVSFRNEGRDNLYIRINGEGLSGITPTDKTYWRILTMEGEKGISNNNETTFMFNWISSQTYNPNSIVSHNNQWWVALKKNLNSEPMEGSLNWKLVMSSMQALYPVSSSRPISQAKGELWFEVIN